MYREALKTIEWLYDEDWAPSRIRDVCLAFEENQIRSKTWLLSKLGNLESFYSSKSAVVVGGWYGYLASLLPTNTVSVDADPLAEIIGKRIFPSINFITSDIDEYDISKHDMLISTAVEHIQPDKLRHMLDRHSGLVCLQSNNEFGYVSPTGDAHINCSSSLDDFINTINLKEVYYSGSLPQGDFERYMVIGEC